LVRIYKGVVKRKFSHIKSVKNWGWINSQKAQEIIGIQGKASSLETPPNYRNDRALVKRQSCPVNLSRFPFHSFTFSFFTIEEFK
jgi:hypothetical protein